MALTLEPEDLMGSCCKNPTTRMITYDCGDGTTQTFLVCDHHFETDEAWSRSAIKVVEFRK